MFHTLRCISFCTLYSSHFGLSLYTSHYSLLTVDEHFTLHTSDFAIFSTQHIKAVHYLVHTAIHSFEPPWALEVLTLLVMTPSVLINPQLCKSRISYYLFLMPCSFHHPPPAAPPPPPVSRSGTPLKSTTGWTGKLWSKTNFLNWQN